MICPTCMVQMHQKVIQINIPNDNNPLHDFHVIDEFCGGGEANDTQYTTWEIKVCPQCGREVKESYSAIVIKEGKAK